ncbi:MAG: 4-alpha-glucanotransferase [Nitrospirota bacterium]|nr:4-alpha-glucanotransferase [Nitrospirota bacterium]
MQTEGQSCSDLLQKLAGLYGIVPEYYDISGRKHLTPENTAKAILRTMQVECESEDALKREIDRKSAKPWDDFVLPVMVISVNHQPCAIPVHIPLGNRVLSDLLLSWTVTDESGRQESFSLAGNDLAVGEEKWFDGIRHLKVLIADDCRRDIGYYSVRVFCTLCGQTETDTVSCAKTIRLIITPDSCYLPDRLKTEQARGLSVNLYSVRSDNNWGIGDFGDLRDIVVALGKIGGDFVGINPLHAIPNTMPYGISPYSPISRLFRNAAYLDISSIPDITSSPKARELMRSSLFRQELEAMRRADFIDYERIAGLKRSVLMLAFDAFLEQHIKGDTDRGKSFSNFLNAENPAIGLFAVYSVLREHMIRTRSVYAWQDWPPEYHDPSGASVQEFAQQQSKSVLFHQYVQWLIDEQLREVRTAADEHGLNIGLYNDLAVGSVAGGSDSWSFGGALAADVDVGAPPDDFSVSGQNWGFPPIIPENLQESGYELFISTIRQNMKHAGALRIDHALGLFRMFWIPSGLSPKEGAYVTCPAEDLLRIIALESVRSKVVVVAEDLGTLEDSFREMLQRFGMLSYRLFYFERNYPDPSFRQPDSYPAAALCAVTTHDLPTLYGFWQGKDIETKNSLGMYQDEDQWKHDLAIRARDRELLIAALRSQGLIGEAESPDGPMTPELCEAIYRYLALTPCRMLLVSLDDVIGTTEQQNLPGTVNEYPNWKQKTPLTLREIITSEHLTKLFAALCNRT